MAEPSMVPPEPPPLDRAALERVLARAAELQARTGDQTDALTDQQILDLGKDVGLSVQHLRQALAEERAGGVRLASGRGARPGLSAERTVPGAGAEVFGALDTWLRKEEALQVKRQFPDRIVWEPRRGLEAALYRALNLGGRGYALSRASDVTATVVPVEEGRVLVRLEAELTQYRRGLVRWSLVGGVAGVLLSAAAFAIHAAPFIAAAPAVLVGAVAFWSARELYDHAATRAQLALEQLLDRLERGDRPDAPSLLKLIAAATGGAPRR